ncbi:hypothetical protein J6590_007639 [Homalodisca vitripennis]|nr:hypothetical protein J6590_007639 [Homalodisca vitripennis]
MLLGRRLGEGGEPWQEKNTMSIHLKLNKSDRKVVELGEGHLDLSPAIQQPNTGFVRCVALSVDEGMAIAYCSFKLYNCCQAKTLVADTLEVHIGHVVLKNSDVTSDVEGCHLYVEYSLLGHCGPELETDSVPKAEVMRFNHSRRLKVMEKNANHLKPMLDPQHPQNLRFFLLSEPCNLSEETDVKVIGLTLYLEIDQNQFHLILRHRGQDTDEARGAANISHKSSMKQMSKESNIVSAEVKESTKFQFADLNLMDELVKKKRDVISEPLPLYNNDGRLLGSLSVTVIGNSTLQNYTDKQYQP